MTEATAAAVHIQGATVRYAEVVRSESGTVVLHLDQRSGDVDFGRALWSDQGAPAALDRLETLVEGMVAGAGFTEMAWVIGPMDAYSLCVPLPAGLPRAERRRRLSYQAALVTDTRFSDALHTISRTIRTAEVEGDAIEWVHVLAAPSSVAGRIGAMESALSLPQCTYVSSPEAAAHVLPTPEEDGADAPPSFQLAIGHYPAHTEYTLTHHGQWHHAHAVEEGRAPENRAYFAVGFLNRVDVPPEEVGAVFAYGPEADTALDGPLAEVLGRTPVLLDPCTRLQCTTNASTEDLARLYVPSIGGAVAACHRKNAS
jgi:hypothetical protein